MQKSQMSHFWRHLRVHCVVAIRSISWLNFASCAWHCIPPALAINGTFAISASLILQVLRCQQFPFSWPYTERLRQILANATVGQVHFMQ
ncbi:MAG: hypothetical protein RL710_898 [Pseudomonadota bacterium]|jgi:hypothetical protein